MLIAGQCSTANCVVGCGPLRALLALYFRLSFHVMATTQIYTLSLHDALPICEQGINQATNLGPLFHYDRGPRCGERRSEHQSPKDHVCGVIHGVGDIHRYLVDGTIEANSIPEFHVTGRASAINESGSTEVGVI